MKLTAAEVKDALRRRHPAYDPAIAGVGRWVCIEEWAGIDLLALDAWGKADVIGYEVKISRSDMRTELLKPSKRAAAVGMCTRFYFACPAGLLRPEELEWEEPDWSPEDFQRERCAGLELFGPPGRWDQTKPRYGGQCQGKPKGRKRVQPFTVELPVPAVYNISERREFESDLHYERRVERDIAYARDAQGHERVPCPVCRGKGYAQKSRVEQESPTLWVPKDVGLVSVGPNGCSVIREAPINKEPASIIPRITMGVLKADGLRPTRASPETLNRLQRQAINQLVRWVSARPDPRHVDHFVS
jgi:hypothetical protein